MNKVYLKAKENNLASISIGDKNYEAKDGVIHVEECFVEQLKIHGFELHFPISEITPTEVIEVVKPKAKGKKNV